MQGPRDDRHDCAIHAMSARGEVTDMTGRSRV
jgi:hypothetical protein